MKKELNESRKTKSETNIQPANGLPIKISTSKILNSKILNN